MKHAECKIKKCAHFEHKIIAYKKASVLKQAPMLFCVLFQRIFCSIAPLYLEVAHGIRKGKLRHKVIVMALAAFKPLRSLFHKAHFALLVNFIR